MYTQLYLSKAYQHPLHLLKTQLPGQIYLANEICALFYTPAPQAESCQPGTAHQSQNQHQKSCHTALNQFGKTCLFVLMLEAAISNERNPFSSLSPDWIQDAMENLN